MTAPDPSRAVSPWWGRLAGPLARVAAQFGSGSLAARRPRVSKEERDQDRVERRAQHAEAKRQADDARDARRRDEAARREEARVEHERALDAAYVHYGRVRDWLAGMRDVAPGVAQLGDGERQMVQALAPLWHADRATVCTLRRWCDPRRGAPARELPDFQADVVEKMRRQVTTLRKQNSADLLVPEVTTLGRGSMIVGDQLHSEDSLRYALAAAALSDAAVLTALRASKVRRIVWEIGGGWGGFAYHIKTLCPNTTYVITGLPERLLVSAVYLMSVFPGARCRLHREPGGPDTWSDWEQVDFVFAVEGTTAGLRPPRLDLTLDVDELRQMPRDRAAEHVERAFAWGSSYFYSTVPYPVAGDPSTAWPFIERWFWPHPIPRRAERSTAYARTVPAEEDFAHLMGWRRLRP